MSKLGTIVTVTDPYTERKCAALVIGEQEDGTLDLRVFRHDQNDIELISVPVAGDEPDEPTTDDAPATTTEAETAAPAAPVEPPAAPAEDGTSHSDQGGPAPVVATPVQ